MKLYTTVASQEPDVEFASMAKLPMKVEVDTVGP